MFQQRYNYQSFVPPRGFFRTASNILMWDLFRQLIKKKKKTEEERKKEIHREVTNRADTSLPLSLLLQPRREFK